MRSREAGRSGFTAPPPDAPLLVRLRAGIRAYRRLKPNVTDPYWGMLYLECFDGKVYRELARRCAGTAEGERLLALRPTLARVDLEALRALPEGTVGRGYAEFFDPEDVSPLPPASPPRTAGQFLCRRMRECHDLHHLLTGYATDFVGEHELQAFQFGNVGTPSSLFALFTSMTKPCGMRRLPYLRRLWRAWRQGRASPPMHLIPWEQHWDSHVRELRSRYLSGAAAEPSETVR